MDKPVKNLAGTVNEAVNALSGVADVAAALKEAAVRVAGRVSQVKALTNDLNTADAALALAVDGATAQPTGNGGPPLDEPSTTSVAPPAPPAAPTSPPPPPSAAQPQSQPDLTLKQSLKAVEAANA